MGGGGGTPLHKLHRYVRSQRYGFRDCSENSTLINNLDYFLSKTIFVDVVIFISSEV